MTYTKSAFEMPNGKYLAKFLGVTLKEDPPGAKPRIGNDGNPLGPAMTWDFEIAEGPEQGKRVDKLTGRIPTPKSGCGKMLAAITDRVLVDGEEVDLSLFVGKLYRITVIENRVADSPPPSLHTGPAPTHQAPPPQTQPQNRPGPGPMPLPSASDPNQRWDYSDGTQVVVGATSAEVTHFFATSGIAPGKIRVKPAGAPREAAKPADQWGFGAAPVAPAANDIPF